MDITICTVSFRSKYYLEINWELSRQLNQGISSCDWVIIENTPIEDTDRFDIGDSRFKVLPGIDMKQISGKYLANYHHGAAMNMALKHVRTRFLLVLDPDFFIIKKYWVSEVFSHMLKEDLAFFGAPWHPRWYMKHRYFPCAHCLFIDLNKIKIEDLNFIPRDCKGAPGGAGLKDQIPFFMKELLRRAVFFFRWLIFNRRDIGKERDTGCALWEKYGNENIRYECMIPVFRPLHDFLGPSYLVSSFALAVERVFPECLCYVPKSSESYSQIGFKERGYPDVSAMGWEEFLWRGDVFGFHIRGYPKRGMDIEKEKYFLLNTLSCFGNFGRFSGIY